MAAPIGPGDWVEYIGGRSLFPASYGAIFLCEAIVEVPPSSGPCGACGTRDYGALTLRGAPHPWGPGWCGCGFRPIYRPNSDLIETLLEPIKEDAPSRETETAQ